MIFPIARRRGQLCGFEGLAERRRSRKLSVAIARGKHLFPFRTEQLSPSAPMVLVLKGTGRVGRRRFIFERAAPRAALSRSAAFALARRRRSPTAEWRFRPARGDQVATRV